MGSLTFYAYVDHPMCAFEPFFYQVLIRSMFCFLISYLLKSLKATQYLCYNLQIMYRDATLKSPITKFSIHATQTPIALA
jgi:hypothetical protein